MNLSKSPGTLPHWPGHTPDNPQGDLQPFDSSLPGPPSPRLGAWRWCEEWSSASRLLVVPRGTGAAQGQQHRDEALPSATLRHAPTRLCDVGGRAGWRSLGLWGNKVLRQCRDPFARAGWLAGSRSRSRGCKMSGGEMEQGQVAPIARPELPSLPTTRPQRPHSHTPKPCPTLSQKSRHSLGAIPHLPPLLPTPHPQSRRPGGPRGKDSHRAGHGHEHAARAIISCHSCHGPWVRGKEKKLRAAGQTLRDSNSRSTPTQVPIASYDLS